MQADAIEPVPDRNASRQLLVVGERDGRRGGLGLPVPSQPVFRDGLGLSDEPLDQLAEAGLELLRGLRDRLGLGGPLELPGKFVCRGPERLDLADRVISGTIGMPVDQPTRVVGQRREDAVADGQGGLDRAGLAQSVAVAGLGGLEILSGPAPTPRHRRRRAGPRRRAGAGRPPRRFAGSRRGPARCKDIRPTSGGDAHRGALGQPADAQGLGRRPREGPGASFQRGREPGLEHPQEVGLGRERLAGEPGQPDATRDARPGRWTGSSWARPSRYSASRFRSGRIGPRPSPPLDSPSRRASQVFRAS